MAKKQNRVAVWTRTGVAVFIFFCFFCSPVFAYDVPATLELPEALPYDDGSTVYQNVLLLFSGTAWWALYHNEPNFYVDDYYLTNATIGSFSNHTWSGNTAGDSWTDEGIDDFNLTAPLFLDTYFGGATDCKNRALSNYAIFSIDNHDASAYCADLFPETFGKEIIPRMDLHGTEINGTIPSAPPVVIGDNNPGSNYVDIPDLLSDPSGFVMASIHNFWVSVGEFFIPDGEYWQTHFDEIQAKLAANYGDLFTLRDTYLTGLSTYSATSGYDPIVIAFTQGGHDYSYTLLDPTSIDSTEYESIKGLIRLAIYFGVFITCVNIISGNKDKQTV